MAQEIKVKLKEAYDTEANWKSKNPVLLAGQLAYSSDKYGKYKIGDGKKTWNQLGYTTLTWGDITGKPSSFTPSSHTHTISQVTDIKNASVNYATTAGGVPWTGITGKPSTFPPSSHTHDDRYYTESEANSRFSPKAGSEELTNLAPVITLGSGGVASIYQKGSTYQQKLEIMDNSTAGDDVFIFSQSKNSGQTFSRLMSIHDDGNVIANKFTGTLAGNASSASNVPWSGITGKPSSFTPSTHSHSASQITGLPTKLPNPHTLTFTGASNVKYDGSGAATVNIPTTSPTPSSLAIQLNGGSTEGKNKFTFNGGAAKTVNITPAGIGAATSGHTHSNYAPTSHTHNYAGSSSAGGSANSAVKLATARTINGVAFDGTKNIEIPNNYSKTLTNEDLNTLITPGNYFAAGGNTVKNKPSGIDNFGLEVYKIAGGHIAQKLHGNNNIIYYRFHNGTSYGGWAEVYSSVNKPTPAEIGAATVSHGTHVPTTCNSIADWNTATKTGWYMGSSAKNAPTSTDWYFGYVICHNTSYVIQEVYKFTASSDAKYIPKYIRACTNGTWGAWTNVTVAKAVPADAVFTDTKYTLSSFGITTSAKELNFMDGVTSNVQTQLNGKASSSHAHKASEIAGLPNIVAITNTQIDSLKSL